MMAAHSYQPPLDPRFRGDMRANADLSKTNWFRVGGRAQWLFKPEDAEDLAYFFRELPLDVPVTVLGVGSNVIIRDGGIDGVVIKLGRRFAECRVWSAECSGFGANHTPHSTLHTLAVGAACLDLNVAQFACDHSISGMEFLCGVPGTVGGAVAMNAGAYGAEIKDVLVSARVVLRSGIIRDFSADEIGFSYRRSKLPEGAIVVSCLLRGKVGDQAVIAARMKEIQSAREETQPIRARTGGSTFKNPDGHKAWELIDRAGCRGMTLGGAQVSEKHCNFLINTGAATAADLEQLGEEVIRRVQEKTGITLEWEIKRIGKL
jgi:UDP-N-acetylmuramate dehydrogenase